MWKVYLLSSQEGGQTYVGATTDLDRRLRQHNSELSGGARYTTSKSFGHPSYWKRILHVDGFRDKIEALQFEWAFKHASRTYAKSHSKNPLERRIFALQLLLTSPKWEHVSVHQENSFSES
jgi:predicted GIY-YIG superfamily endonuclease